MKRIVCQALSLLLIAPSIAVGDDAQADISKEAKKALEIMAFACRDDSNIEFERSPSGDLAAWTDADEPVSFKRHDWASAVAVVEATLGPSTSGAAMAMLSAYDLGADTSAYFDESETECLRSAATRMLNAGLGFNTPDVLGSAAIDAKVAAGMFEAGSEIVPTGTVGYDTNWFDVQIDQEHDCLSTVGQGSNICLNFTYDGGAATPVGVYWSSADQGNLLGADEVRRLTFWARGDSGEETVQFMAAGDISADSYLVKKDPVVLTRDWKRYEIDLQNVDLQGNRGIFAWYITPEFPQHSQRPNLRFQISGISLER